MKWATLIAVASGIPALWYDWVYGVGPAWLTISTAVTCCSAMPWREQSSAAGNSCVSGRRGGRKLSPRLLLAECSIRTAGLALISVTGERERLAGPPIHRETESRPSDFKLGPPICAGGQEGRDSRALMELGPAAVDAARQKREAGARIAEAVEPAIDHQRVEPPVAVDVAGIELERWTGDRIRDSGPWSRSDEPRCPEYLDPFGGGDCGRPPTPTASQYQ